MPKRFENPRKALELTLDFVKSKHNGVVPQPFDKYEGIVADNLAKAYLLHGHGFSSETLSEENEFNRLKKYAEDLLAETNKMRTANDELYKEQNGVLINAVSVLHQAVILDLLDDLPEKQKKVSERGKQSLKALLEKFESLI